MVNLIEFLHRLRKNNFLSLRFADFEKPLVVFSIMSIIYELTGDGSEMVFPENTNRMYSVVGAKFSDSGFSYLGQALNGSITVR